MHIEPGGLLSLSGTTSGAGTEVTSLLPAADVTDRTLAALAEYVCDSRFEDLPGRAVHACKQRVVDTVGCALAAFDAEPTRIAHALTRRARCDSGSRTIGGAQRVLPELAAFANGVMARYLDGNDTYPGGGGHPSDTIAAALGVADAVHSDGKSLITSIATAYEVYNALAQAVPLRARSFDNVYYVAVGAAAAAAKLLALDRTRTAHALSLALTSNLALGATRHGALSMWKGCAAADAARNGVFAALLAAEGMTGPDRPIEGVHGLWALLGHAKLPPFGATGEYAVQRSALKAFLAEYHSQGPIALALELRAQVAPEEIAAITIHTYWFAWHVIGSEREKWRPTSRETADHSLPYIVAAVIVDGRFSDDIFSGARLRDPRIHALSDRITIEEDPALTRRFPESVPCRMEIVTHSGKQTSAETDHPLGHPANPMTDEQVSAKFSALAQHAMPEERVRLALDTLWQLESSRDLDRLFGALTIAV